MNFRSLHVLPEPDRKSHDLAQILRDAITLQRAGLPGVRIVETLPDAEITVELDDTMIGQALTNLIKNAGEAIESLQEKGAPEEHVPEIRVEMELKAEGVCIRIADNGIGLPEDRAKLFEPYVTTRDAGTGLGLPIVKKIIEEHGGTSDGWKTRPHLNRRRALRRDGCDHIARHSDDAKHRQTQWR